MSDIHGMPIMNHRRDILRACLRGGGLLALGGVASLLGWRNLQGTCLRSDPCGACPWFSGCGLPKAREEKSQGAAGPGAAGSNKNTLSKHA